MNPSDARLNGGLEGFDRVDVPLDGFPGGADRDVVRLVVLASGETPRDARCVEPGVGSTGSVFNWANCLGV